MDSPKLQADAYCDLAAVLEVAGRPVEAVAAWQEALGRYERKQIISLLCRVRDRLSALTETSGWPKRSWVIPEPSLMRRALCEGKKVATMTVMCWVQQTSGREGNAQWRQSVRRS